MTGRTNWRDANHKRPPSDAPYAAALDELQRIQEQYADGRASTDELTAAIDAGLRAQLRAGADDVELKLERYELMERYSDSASYAKRAAVVAELVQRLGPHVARIIDAGRSNG